MTTPPTPHDWGDPVAAFARVLDQARPGPHGTREPAAPPPLPPGR